MHSVGNMGWREGFTFPPDSTKDPAVRKPLGTSDVLEQTLLITTSATDEQLVSRTLAAACAVTGGVVAAALAPVGERQTHGDSILAARLVAATRGPLDLRAGGPTTAFAAAGLPSAITMAVRRHADRGRVARARPPRHAEAASLARAAGRPRRRDPRPAASSTTASPARPSATRSPASGTTGRSRSGSAAARPAGPRSSRSTWTTSRRSTTSTGTRPATTRCSPGRGAAGGAARRRPALPHRRRRVRGRARRQRGRPRCVTIARRLLEAARQIGQTVSVGAAVQLPGRDRPGDPAARRQGACTRRSAPAATPPASPPDPRARSRRRDHGPIVMIGRSWAAPHDRHVGRAVATSGDHAGGRGGGRPRPATAPGRPARPGPLPTRRIQVKITRSSHRRRHRRRLRISTESGARPVRSRDHLGEQVDGRS